MNTKILNFHPFKEVYAEEFNRAPKGFEEITQEEFAKSKFFYYSHIASEYKQITENFDGTPIGTGNIAIPIKLFWFFDGTGVGISNNWLEWTLKFFRFGCCHKYEEYSKEIAVKRNLPYSGGRCMHNMVCTKCGHIYQYDSSD